jgi:teichuronic acid exporter
MPRKPTTPAMPSEKKPRGYANAASSGTWWTTAQGILNKFATAFAMFMVARALSTEAFALASVVIVASGFIMVIPTFVMGDVVITHQNHLSIVSLTARRIVMRTAAVMTVVMLAAAPAVSLWYPQYPYAEMVMLLTVSAARPLADALGVFPLSALRTDLRYREIAIINGTVQLGASVVTVLWAVQYPGAAAIVVPQILAAIAKTGWCAVAARGSPSAAHWNHFKDRPGLASAVYRRLLREFTSAALAQYIHTLVSGLPFMVTAWFSNEADTGYFAFAFSLANQAASVLSYQLAIVLQPIFGRLKSQPERQIAGFMRVIALMGALAVPLALLQAAFAQPLFVLVFKEKWLPAIPIFVALSVGQAFFFMTAPAMALLKAQGRFVTYFIWQALQAGICLAIFPLMVKQWGGVAVAWTDTALWLFSVPLAVWLGARVTGVTLGAIARCFFVPWITAGPIALAGWAACRWMPLQVPVVCAAALLLVAPVCFFLSIMAVRFTQPHVFAEVAPSIRRITRLVPMIGASLSRLLVPNTSA